MQTFTISRSQRAIEVVSYRIDANNLEEAITKAQQAYATGDVPGSVYVEVNTYLDEQSPPIWEQEE